MQDENLVHSLLSKTQVKEHGKCDVGSTTSWSKKKWGLLSVCLILSNGGQVTLNPWATGVCLVPHILLALLSA